MEMNDGIKDSRGKTYLIFPTRHNLHHKLLMQEDHELYNAYLGAVRGYAADLSTVATHQVRNKLPRCPVPNLQKSCKYRSKGTK
jgi:hypothetical protein